jgi:hypothetical protein
VEPICPVGTRVPNDAASTGSRIDNQVGARAEEAPLRVATGHLERVPAGLRVSEVGLSVPPRTFSNRVTGVGRRFCSDRTSEREVARSQLKEAVSPWRGCDGRSFPHRLTSRPRCCLRALQQRATPKAINGASHQKREPRREPNGNRDDRNAPIRADCLWRDVPNARRQDPSFSRLGY